MTVVLYFVISTIVLISTYHDGHEEDDVYDDEDVYDHYDDFGGYDDFGDVDGVLIVIVFKSLTSIVM